MGLPTLYDNCTIVTLDDERQILTDAALVVDGSRIAAIGKRQAVRTTLPAEAERVDLGGGLMTPGLVNTHVHLSQALIRGCADDLALVDWLTKRVWVLQGNYGSR